MRHSLWHQDIGKNAIDYLVQGNHTTCAKPPVDFKTKVPLLPGLPWPGLAKGKLLS